MREKGEKKRPGERKRMSVLLKQKPVGGEERGFQATGKLPSQRSNKCKTGKKGKKLKSAQDFRKRPPGKTRGNEDVKLGG